MSNVFIESENNKIQLSLCIPYHINNTSTVSPPYAQPHAASKSTNRKILWSKWDNDRVSHQCAFFYALSNQTCRWFYSYKCHTCEGEQAHDRLLDCAAWRDVSEAFYGLNRIVNLICIRFSLILKQLPLNWALEISKV